MRGTGAGSALPQAAERLTQHRNYRAIEVTELPPPLRRHDSYRCRGPFSRVTGNQPVSNSVSLRPVAARLATSRAIPRRGQPLWARSRSVRQPKSLGSRGHRNTAWFLRWCVDHEDVRLGISQPNVLRGSPRVHGRHVRGLRDRRRSDRCLSVIATRADVLRSRHIVVRVARRHERCLDLRCGGPKVSSARKVLVFRVPGQLGNTHAECEIQIGRNRIPVTAHPTLPVDADYSRRWTIADTVNKGRYTRYQEKTRRTIPIVELRRRPAS